MSCRNYDPCLDSKLNQIGSYASVARQSAQSATASAAAAAQDAAQSAASAGAAAESAAEAAASAEIAGIYLGAFAVPPTTDNQGGPLQDGMLYYNTVSDTMFVWDGLSWITATGFNEATPFLATGTTTPRNLVTRMADVVNVKDFGAVGDNVTDDTAAIQAAIDYSFLIGSGIYFPKGIFKTNSGIKLKTGCSCNSEAIIVAGSPLITTVTIETKSSYARTHAFNLPQIVGGENGLLLKGVSIATINISNIALSKNGLVLEIGDTYKICADNNINFNTINGCSEAGIKFNFLATTTTGTLFQGNIIRGNFIASVKYGIHFYDANNGSLPNLTWDDTLIEIGAIDPRTTGSIGIYGEPTFPPARFTVKCENFFDGCDLAYIKGYGNNGLYRLAFSSQLEYDKNQLQGIYNQIINTGLGWKGTGLVTGAFAAIPLSETINSRLTFNGGASLQANRNYLKFTIPVGGWAAGTYKIFYCYHALTTFYGPVVRIEPQWIQPMRVQFAVENSTPGINVPGSGSAPYPNQIAIRIQAYDFVAEGEYALALTLHNTP
jgi:hypothetical protein